MSLAVESEAGVRGRGVPPRDQRPGLGVVQDARDVISDLRGLWLLDDTARR